MDRKSNDNGGAEFNEFRGREFTMCGAKCAGGAWKVRMPG